MRYAVNSVLVHVAFPVCVAAVVVGVVGMRVTFAGLRVLDSTLNKIRKHS